MIQQSHSWVYILSREKHGLKGYMYHYVFAVLFTKAKPCKQPKCLLTDE